MDKEDFLELIEEILEPLFCQDCKPLLHEIIEDSKELGVTGILYE